MGIWAEAILNHDRVSVLFLLAAQIKKYKNPSLSKAQKQEYVPILVRITPPKKWVGIMLN
jgi:hypothetical protein